MEKSKTGEIQNNSSSTTNVQEHLKYSNASNGTNITFITTVPSSEKKEKSTINSGILKTNSGLDLGKNVISTNSGVASVNLKKELRVVQNKWMALAKSQWEAVKGDNITQN